MSEPPRALCSECGQPMMLDHTVCFSDDCVRARWEAAGDWDPKHVHPTPEGVDLAAKLLERARAPHGRCEDCGQPLVHITGPNAGGVMCRDCDETAVEDIDERNSHGQLVENVMSMALGQLLMGALRKAVNVDVELPAGMVPDFVSTSRPVATVRNYTGKPITVNGAEYGPLQSYGPPLAPSARGTCETCGTALQHYTGYGLRGVLCPQCDAVHCDELDGAEDSTRKMIATFHEKQHAVEQTHAAALSQLTKQLALPTSEGLMLAHLELKNIVESMRREAAESSKTGDGPAEAAELVDLAGRLAPVVELLWQLAQRTT